MALYQFQCAGGVHACLQGPPHGRIFDASPKLFEAHSDVPYFEVNYTILATARYPTTPQLFVATIETIKQLESFTEKPPQLRGQHGCTSLPLRYWSVIVEPAVRGIQRGPPLSSKTPEEANECRPWNAISGEEALQFTLSRGICEVPGSEVSWIVPWHQEKAP